jgi:hypothetical protein
MLYINASWSQMRIYYSGSDNGSYFRRVLLIFGGLDEERAQRSFVEMGGLIRQWRSSVAQ